MTIEYDIAGVLFRPREAVRPGQGIPSQVRHPRLCEESSVFSKKVHGNCPFDTRGEGQWLELMLAAVRDLREHRAPASPEELEKFEVDVLAGFVLARDDVALVH
jgi:hypothetical protein